MSEVIKRIFEQEMEFIINQMIKDYRWMKREVNRLQKLIYGWTSPMQSWGVA